MSFKNSITKKNIDKMPTRDDFLRRGSLSGGRISERGLPDPLIRRYPNEYGIKRQVYVRLSSFIGLSAGAQHYYVEISEEHNSIWDEDSWWDPWDDDDGKGDNTIKRLERRSFKTPLSAIQFAEQYLDEHFSKDTHEFDWSQTMEIFFQYRREGD